MTSGKSTPSLWHGYQQEAELALQTALERAGLPSVERYHLAVPKGRQHGHLASPIALQLARQLGQSPLAIAEKILQHLPRSATFEEVIVAKPGFINFSLAPAALRAVLGVVREHGAAYGHTHLHQGERILLEFCSANPTGLLHIGHARGAVVGDVLARLLRATGCEVHTEYYINDAGNQMDLLAASLEAHYLTACGQAVTFPEDGYAGPEVKEVATAAWQEEGDRLVGLPPAERLEFFRSYGYKEFLARIRADLAQYRIQFDNWFRESDLYADHSVESAVAVLQERGYLYEEDGATWFRATQFGDSKDRVLRKSDGSPTYLMADVAYHRGKLERNFPQLINILGSDHHSYAVRLQATLPALGYEAAALEIIFTQMVRLFRNGEPVVLSKRKGTNVTLRDLLEEIGVDAARFFFIWTSPDAHLDVDLELALSRTKENPVYYIQYAHARLCSIQREAATEKLAPGEHFEQLGHPIEQELFLQLLLFPQEIAEAAKARAPQRIPAYLQQLASTFHRYYATCRILGEGEELGKQRLALCAAVQQVLRNGLELLGIEAPTRM